MAGFGKKLLGIIGLEEVEEGEGGYYDEDVQTEQPADYPEDEYEPVEEPSYTSRNYGGASGAAPKAAPASRQHSQTAAGNGYARNNRRPVNGSYVSTSDPNNLNILVYEPSSYDETQEIIDNLKRSCPIIVNLDALDTDVAQRILDFMSGAVYALSGSIRKVARNTFVVAPNGVDVMGNLTGETMSASAGDFDGHYFSDGDV